MKTAEKSIRRRTMRVVMTTTLVALLLSAATLLGYELRSHRSAWIEDLQTQAELVARICLPALQAADARAAGESLALLGVQANIEAAGLYDAKGALVASYSTPGGKPVALTLAAQPGSSHSFEREMLEVRRAIGRQDAPLGTPLGTLVVRARYDLQSRLSDYLTILALVTLVSLVMTALVSGRLQRTITDPIVAVSDTARDVVRQRNFDLRATKTTDDEVGVLVDAFNDMLSELGGQAAALQAADRRKDEFLAILAHELRNPLAPISTALAMLQRGSTDADTQARLVAMMQRQLKHFVRLIDDLMEVSRISTGRLTLTLERLDLVDLVRQAVANVTPALLERQQTLSVRWPEPVWIAADRTRLGQVFTNVLGNAAKYSEVGGVVALSFQLDTSTVSVHVTDKGVGIASEMLGEIFEMFAQVDRNTGREQAGLGVGLALARQLVKLHRGRISAFSAGLGKGARFTVELPRQPPPAHGAPQPPQRGSGTVFADGGGWTARPALTPDPA